MTSDDLIKIMGVVVTLIIAWLGYQQVKPKNTGDAVYATAQSVVLLSKRVDEVEAEKSELSDRLEAEITRLRKELDTAREVVAGLRQTIQNGEAAMGNLQKQFERDALLRANIEEALRVATERIKQLEADNLNLSMRLTTVEKERAKEQEAWTTERRIWRDGIWKVIKQITDLNPGVVPAWRPPDTQPLGKFEGNL